VLSASACYQAEFRYLCDTLLEYAERSATSAGLGALAVRTCVLPAPPARGNDSTTRSTARRVVAIASALPPPSHHERSRLGPALYRFGAVSEALAHLTAFGAQAEEDRLWSEYNRIFLAFTMYASGDGEAAFAEAKRVWNRLAQDRFFAWDDKLELDLLAEELASVIRCGQEENS
jgi:hypothetical protein